MKILLRRANIAKMLARKQRKRLRKRRGAASLPAAVARLARNGMPSSASAPIAWRACSEKRHLLRSLLAHQRNAQ